MKKTAFVFTIIISVFAISGVLIAAAASAIKNSFIKAVDDAIWYHFPAVAPTATEHGSKEFWTSSADNCETHTLVDPNEGPYIEKDFSTYDSFTTLSFEDDRYVYCLNAEELGIIPVIDNVNMTITYGLFPQTHVNDESTIDVLNDLFLNGDGRNTQLFNGEYYLRRTATTCTLVDNPVFDDGTPIVSGEIYWFKYEPIKWNILSNNGNEYLLLSSDLLFACKYMNVSSNTYEVSGETYYANEYYYSYLRYFLTQDFYTSFKFNESYIQTTTVDNSASTTESNDNPFTCENTYDTVFSLSYKDYLNPDYGFSTSTDPSNTRCSKTTDYARSRGAYYSTDPLYLYNGWYWTRSPYFNSIYPEDTRSVTRVSFKGHFNLGTIDFTFTCIRPAITIKIS